jgi:hypothetical protein
VKIGVRIVRHGRSIIFQTAEVTVPRDLFRRHPGSDRRAAAQGAGSMLNTRSGTNALKFRGETCAYILNHGTKTAPCSAFAARSSGVPRPSAPECLLNCYRQRLSVEHDRPVRGYAPISHDRALAYAARIVEAR